MQASHPQNRSGYTLMEMLVVLALIVIVTAISIPVLSTYMGDSRATAAGDILRGRMAEARARAMDEGRPWRLGYIPGTRIYQIAPDDSTEWAQPSQDLSEKADFIRDALPEEVYFGKTREEIQNAQGAATPGRDWEIAAVFMPDGSARDDSFVYFGKLGTAPMRIRLRALIGGVTVEAYQQQKADQP